MADLSACNRYNAYGPWLRKRFGCRVYKVSVDGGFTCPNRDGTVAWGGCSYCNNDSFRASPLPQRPVQEQILSGIRYLEDRFAAEAFLVYWQNYTNTYAPVERLRLLFSESLNADPRILGLSIGTRPDCIEEEKLEMLQEVVGDRYLCMEYGLESIYDETLRRVNRGHDFACYLDAVRRTRRRGIAVCSHLILGFPGESRAQMLAYADVLNELDINFVKIHHLHVVRNTPLAKEYQVAPFPTFAYREWIEFVVDFLERLAPSIVVQRLYGWAPDSHLIAPRWNRSKERILYDILQELESRDSWQGKKRQETNGPRADEKAGEVIRGSFPSP